MRRKPAAAPRRDGGEPEIRFGVGLTAAFAGCLDRQVRSLGFHRLKGLAEPVEAYALEAVDGARG